MKNRFIYFLAAAVVVIGTSLLLNDRFRAQHSSQKTTPTSEVPVDTENDGVYTNYEYGFRFEYPEDVFVYFSPLTHGGEVTGAMFRDNEEGFPGILSLTVLLNNPGSGLEYFEKFEKMPLNTFEYSEEYLQSLGEGVSPVGNTMKIREIEVGEVKGFVLYSEYIGGETEPTNSHSFSLLKDGNVITVNTTAPSGLNRDPYKEERLKILNGILESFEFFTPAS